MSCEITLSERIHELVQQHGSLRAVARITKIDVGYLSRLRNGDKRTPGAAVLRILGLKAVITYVRTD